MLNNLSCSFPSMCFLTNSELVYKLRKYALILLGIYNKQRHEEITLLKCQMLIYNIVRDHNIFLQFLG